MKFKGFYLRAVYAVMFLIVILAINVEGIGGSASRAWSIVAWILTAILVVGIVRLANVQLVFSEGVISYRGLLRSWNIHLSELECAQAVELSDIRPNPQSMEFITKSGRTLKAPMAAYILPRAFDRDAAHFSRITGIRVISEYP